MENEGREMHPTRGDLMRLIGVFVDTLEMLEADPGQEGFEAYERIMGGHDVARWVLGDGAADWLAGMLSGAALGEIEFGQPSEEFWDVVQSATDGDPAWLEDGEPGLGRAIDPMRDKIASLLPSLSSAQVRIVLSLVEALARENQHRI